MTNKPMVFDSRIDVSKVKFEFKKKLNRKEREHMQALSKAQSFIDNKDLKSEEAKQKKDDIIDESLLRKNTPRYKGLGAAEAFTE